MTPGQRTSLDGFVPFQGTDSLWNIDISNLPVDPDWDKIIAFIGASAPLHPASVVVNPSATTTCELYSTNEYGRSVAKVKVTVH
jgi:hypothetical protein